MLKFFDELCDKFTSKSFKFKAERKDGDEVLEMIQKSTKTESLFSKGNKPREMTFKVNTEEGITYYIITIELTDGEWLNLLKECESKNYQLIVNKDYDEKCFVKIKES